MSSFTAIDTIYRDFAEKNHIPGCSYGIVQNGKLVHTGSYGFINIDKKIPATAQSMFRIASMSKSFTAMAIVKLRDEGLLTLDDPIDLYIPELKGQKLTVDAPQITLRDLLTHAAGFPTDDPWGDRQLAMTSQELIAFIKNGISFSTTARTTYEYSNLGYALLGYVIEKVTHLSYGQYISETIWHPLNMKHAAWEYADVPTAQLAQGYRWRYGRWEEEDMLHDGIFGAMGGMIASVESFSHYIALHQSAWPPRNDLDTGPLKRSSLREMQQPLRFKELAANYKYADGRACPLVCAYGYGLKWLQDRDKRVFVGHSGGLPGFGSNWLFMPDYGIGIVFLANVTYAAGESTNLTVLDLLLKELKIEPRQILPTQVLKERKEAFVKLLPDWKNAEESAIFAANFFLDHSIDLLQEHSLELFVKAGTIVSVSEVIAENQLRGYFILKGENLDLQVQFGLSPEKIPLIQYFQIKEV